MRKLPVFEALTHALKSTWHNMPFAFHASWPWMLVLIPMNLYFQSGMENFDPTTTDPVKQVEMAKAMLTFYAVSAISMVIYSSIGVTWHRYILQDEMPQGAARLRLDGTVWRYVGNTLLIGLMVVFGILPLALIASMLMSIAAVPIQMTMPVYVGLALLVALPLTYRFSLKLPAIAIGNKHFRLGDGWNVTRGNMPQLMVLSVSVFGALTVMGLVLGYVEQGVQQVLGEQAVYVFGLVRQLIAWLVAIFTITMLTSLYGFFVEKRDF